MFLILWSININRFILTNTSFLSCYRELNSPHHGTLCQIILADDFVGYNLEHDFQKGHHTCIIARKSVASKVQSSENTFRPTLNSIFLNNEKALVCKYPRHLSIIGIQLAKHDKLKLRDIKSNLKIKTFRQVLHCLC